MAQSTARESMARILGGFLALGAGFFLPYSVMLSLTYGGSIFNAPTLTTCTNLFVLLILGIGTMAGKHLARLVLSILFPLQVCWVTAVLIGKTSSAGQTCYLSCFDGPLEVIALPIALSFVAAWVIYPGRVERNTR